MGHWGLRACDGCRPYADEFTVRKKAGYRNRISCIVRCVQYGKRAGESYKTVRQQGEQAAHGISSFQLSAVSLTRQLAENEHSPKHDRGRGY